MRFSGGSGKTLVVATVDGGPTLRTALSWLWAGGLSSVPGGLFHRTLGVFSSMATASPSDTDPREQGGDSAFQDTLLW